MFGFTSTPCNFAILKTDPWMVAIRRGLNGASALQGAALPRAPFILVGGWEAAAP